jgi:biofilm PGA synthesis N-glycosyltransferase PgaC
MDIGSWGVYGVLFLALYFEVFLFLSFMERRPTGKSSARPKRYPSVAIVVPAHNEERTLEQTIRTLLGLEYPKDKLEIIIVDDGSTDSTRAIGEALAKQYAAVRFYHKANGGKYTALNFAIERTQAELVGCLDADSFVSPDALVETIKTFEQNADAYAVIPAMQVYKPKKALELMQAVEYTFGIFVKKMFDNLAAISVLPGPFSIYRREVFSIVGPFRHAHNTEDMEIAFRMHEHGLKICNAHTALVFTTVPSTVRALVKQRTRWSQGFLQNTRDYAHMLGRPRYGNFGTLTLPFGVAMFAGALYTFGFLFYSITASLVRRAADIYATGIPPTLELALPRLDWFFIETGTMTFVALTVMTLTFVAILIGRRIGDTGIGFKSFAMYFMIYGFVVPLWLGRAAWGAILARESSWR